MNPGTDIEEIETHGVSLAELEAEMNRLWDALQTEPALQQEAGLDPTQLQALGPLRADVIAMRVTTQYADPFSIAALVIAAQPALSVVAKDVWKRIILPRLIQKWGPERVKPATKKKP